MAFCGICEKECSDGGVIKCVGKCERVFHLQCVKQEAEGKLTRSAKDWKCSSCRSKPSHGSVKSTSSTAEVLTKDFLVKVLEEFKKDVFAEITAFKTELNDLTSSVQHISDKLDESSVLMEEIKSQFSEIKAENQVLRSKNDALSREVVDLRERMRNLEQYSRVNNIEIGGMPSTRDENVRDLVVDVGAALGVEVRSTDIAAAHRVPTYRSDREPPIVVQFTTRTLKEQWMASSRKKKGLTARDVNQSYPVRRVYVNEHLSPENKQFLARLKRKGKELGYAYIWSRDGKFFVRKAEGTQVKRINTYEELEKLK